MPNNPYEFEHYIHDDLEYPVKSKKIIPKYIRNDGEYFKKRFIQLNDGRKIELVGDFFDKVGPMIEEMEKIHKKRQEEQVPPKDKKEEAVVDPFFDAFINESALRDISSNHMIFAYKEDEHSKATAKLFSNKFRGMLLYSMNYNQDKIGRHFSDLCRVHVVILFNILNFFPTFMESALLLKEAATFNRGNYLLVRAMSEETVKALAEKNEWKFKKGVYVFKDADGVKRTVRGLTEGEIRKIAYFARIKKVATTNKLDKLSDPCTLFVL